ncbi:MULTISPECIES: hypothetical protein [Haloarcula]|uniref:hypothetical protein n=1 Tax=Haloarcula TaxID=2237 RepID=UPI0023E85B65|nr:hypothetical protein [Halomicroarcula sp. SHR3]
MKRRTFLLGTGITASTGVAVLGTGAFSGVEADRNVVVDVTGDAEAFVRLSPVSGPAGNGDYATETQHGELQLTISENNESVDGGGLNAQATTVITDVFTVGNQGTEDIELRIDPVVFPDTDLAIGIIPQDRDPTSPVSVPVGSHQVFGIAATADGSIDPPSVSETVTVRAEVSR